MRKSLCVAGALALVLGHQPAMAQMFKGLAPDQAANLARQRALDLRIRGDPALTRARPLVRGMLVSRDLAPNAKVGIGLADLYGRKKNGGDFRINGGPGRGRKPAVTFQLRF